MTPAFEKLLQELKRLPGLGFRSAERIAMHLLVEQPEALEGLMESMGEARIAVRRCDTCGNIAESPKCAICEDQRRTAGSLCVVEHVPDLIAIKRSAAWPRRNTCGDLLPYNPRNANNLSVDIRVLDNVDIANTVVCNRI